MISRTIQVFTGSNAKPELVGTLRFEADGSRESVAFAYADAWLSYSGRYNIDPTLFFGPGWQYHRKQYMSVFHPALADAEPDGWGRRVILRDHLKRRAAGASVLDKRALDSMDFLLAVDDFSRVGALRFRDEKGEFQRVQKKGHRTAPPLIQLQALVSATRSVEQDQETEADLAYLRGCGTSLGGMRPKCTIQDDDGHLAIGKFPSVADERPVTKGEVLVMQLASEAGIRTADTRLVDGKGVPVVISRRFDRTPTGERVPFLSAAAFLGLEKGDPSEHYYTELVERMRSFGSHFEQDREELWRRIAFNIFVTNLDDHLHNIGFLHDHRDLWRLAPAYDLNPFPDRQGQDLKTWISEDTGPQASIDNLCAASRGFGLKQNRMMEILKEVKKAVAGWTLKGAALGLTRKELDQFAPAFEHVRS